MEKGKNTGEERSPTEDDSFIEAEKEEQLHGPLNQKVINLSIPLPNGEDFAKAGNVVAGACKEAAYTLGSVMATAAEKLYEKLPTPRAAFDGAVSAATSVVKFTENAVNVLYHLPETYQFSSTSITDLEKESRSLYLLNINPGNEADRKQRDELIQRLIQIVLNPQNYNEENDNLDDRKAFLFLFSEALKMTSLFHPQLIEEPITYPEFNYNKESFIDHIKTKGDECNKALKKGLGEIQALGECFCLKISEDSKTSAASSSPSSLAASATSSGQDAHIDIRANLCELTQIFCNLKAFLEEMDCLGYLLDKSARIENIEKAIKSIEKKDLGEDQDSTEKHLYSPHPCPLRVALGTAKVTKNTTQEKKHSPM